MKANFFKGRVGLVIPFLVIFYFPVVASIYSAIIKHHPDWNGSLVGLFGNAAAVPPADRTMKAWWEGEFQKEFSSWWEGYCPSRAFFLRLFNQVDYSCFRSSYILQGKMIIGPGGQLDVKEYVLDASHQGAFTSDQVPELMAKLEKLRADLQRQGKGLLIVTTPDKAATYPDTIPPRFLAYDTSKPRAFDAMVAAMGQTGIPFVNGAGMIHELAGKSPYPFFMRGGGHWNRYAAAQVLPTVVEEISRLTGKTWAVPSIERVNVVTAVESQSPTDHDLVYLLNVWSTPANYDCPNIDLEYPPKPPGAEPKIVMAGGSFCWQLLELVTGSPARADTPRVPFAFYTKDYFDGVPTAPMTRAGYERALAGSELVVLEINEDMPQSTVDGLSTIVDEANRLPQSPVGGVK